MKAISVLGLGLMPFILFFLLGAVIGAICWTYSINTWLVFAHKNPAIVWWQGMLIGFIPGIGHFGLVVAIGTWVAMMFLR